MSKMIKRSWTTWAYSDLLVIFLSLVAIAALLLWIPGCSGLTLGPVVERKAVIVRAGTGIEILENIEVDAHVLQDTGGGQAEVFKQGIGGWIAMHPDHWEAVKREINRLRVKAGEAKPPNPLVPPGGQ